MDRRSENSRVYSMGEYHPHAQPLSSRSDTSTNTAVTSTHSDLNGPSKAIDNAGARISGSTVPNTPSGQSRGKGHLICIEAPTSPTVAETLSTPEAPVNGPIEQVFQLSLNLALVEESVIETDSLTENLDRETTVRLEHHADQNNDGRPLCVAKLMNLPEEIEDIILDNLPFFQDQIHLAAVSLQTCQNGVARSVLRRWRHQLFGNPVLRRKLFTGAAFKGEKSVPDGIAVGLLSRAMREGIDKPSSRTQSLHGFKSGNSTYHDLPIELDDASSNTFAGQWIIPEKADMEEPDTKKPNIMKRDLKMSLTYAREAEEDVRYFKPRGKAWTLINCLNDLIDTHGLTGICWGCVSFDEVEQAWFNVSPGTHPRCTDCVSIECEDLMINVAFLETVGIMTPGSIGAWPKRVVLANGMSYFSKVDANRLSVLQYGKSYYAWTAKFNELSDAGQKKVLQDAARFRVCLEVVHRACIQYTNAHDIVGPLRNTRYNLQVYHLPLELMVQLQEHAGYIDVSGYEWFRTAFTSANSRYALDPPNRQHSLLEWTRRHAAYGWHALLYGHLRRVTLGCLRRFTRVVRLPEIESLMPTKTHALDEFSCTLEHIDTLCKSIHGCNYAGVMKMTAERRTKNLSLYFAQTACLLKAIHDHTYGIHAPNALQACADLLALFGNAQASHWTPRRRLKFFCDLAVVTHFRSFCRLNLDRDGDDVFNALNEVPDDLTTRAAAAFWTSHTFGGAFRQQLRP